DDLALMWGGDPSRTAGHYWLLAEKILTRTPYTGVSPKLSALLRPKVIRREQNATLNNLLRARWPQLIEKLAETKQGTFWDYLAQVWLDVGDREAAAEALERAERSG